jgi:hypothetical protein
MFSVVLKLIYFPGASDLVLPEYSERQARLQKQDKPVMIFPPANGPADY